MRSPTKGDADKQVLDSSSREAGGRSQRGMQQKWRDKLRGPDARTNFTDAITVWQALGIGGRNAPAAQPPLNNDCWRAAVDAIRARASARR